MRHRDGLLAALLAALSILTWQELVIRYHYHGNQTALFCTGSKFDVPPELRQGTYVFANSPGYDGQFYRYVAHDPFLRKGFANSIDAPRYRYGRILIPLIAWAVSGGQQQLIDRAFQFTVAAFCALGVYWTCSYLLLEGCAPVWGLAVFLLVPATLTSVDRLLIDGPLCALFAGFLYYTRLDRSKAVYAIALLAPLIRETGFLLLAGVVGAAILKKQWKRAAVFATAALPALLWARFVAAHTRPGAAIAIFEKPVIGLFIRLFTVRAYPGASGSVYPLLQSLDFLSMAGYIICLAIAIRWLWSLREERWAAPGIAIACFVLLALALGNQEHLADTYGYARPVSPLILWIMLRATARRAWAILISPLLVSAGVGVYLVSPAWSIVKGLWIS